MSTALHKSADHAEPSYLGSRIPLEPAPDVGCDEPRPDFKALASPELPDAELEPEALGLLACGPHAPEVVRALTARAAHFERRRDRARAAVALELAAGIDPGALDVIHARARLAAQAADPVLAAHWLWRLAHSQPDDRPDYSAGAPSAIRQLRTAGADPAFAAVHASPEVQSVLACTPRSPSFRRPLRIPGE